MNKKFIIKLFISAAIITCYVACDGGKNKPVTNENKNQIQEINYLSSWSDSTRQLIETWMKMVTDTNASTYIPVTDRIAVFDNDGTLWPEQPVPNQFIFAMDNLKELSSGHPEFKKDPLMNDLLNGNMASLKRAGIPGLLKLIDVTHNNQTEKEFRNSVLNWIDTAKDQRFGRLYKKIVYQPMIELLNYLRANDFKTFIVSGGGADFMRPWAEDTYGIPPYQVIGSYGEVAYDVANGNPRIKKLSGAPFIDDKEGKPVAIHRFIGKVPVFCAGNSDGDQAMLQYTGGSRYKSFGLILHHTDSVREYKYDLKTLSGHLETTLIEAKEKNWLVVDMEKDFKKIFAFE